MWIQQSPNHFYLYILLNMHCFSSWKLLLFTLHPDKYIRYMHFDHGNPCRKNNIKGHALATTSAERDLGVIISPSMKQHEKVHAAVGLPQNLCAPTAWVCGRCLESLHQYWHLPPWSVLRWSISINSFDIVSWNCPQLWRSPREAHRVRLIREIVHSCEPRHHFPTPLCPLLLWIHSKQNLMPIVLLFNSDLSSLLDCIYFCWCICDIWPLQLFHYYYYYHTIIPILQTHLGVYCMIPRFFIRKNVIDSNNGFQACKAANITYNKKNKLQKFCAICTRSNKINLFTVKQTLTRIEPLAAPLLNLEKSEWSSHTVWDELGCLFYLFYFCERPLLSHTATWTAIKFQLHHVMFKLYLFAARSISHVFCVHNWKDQPVRAARCALRADGVAARQRARLLETLFLFNCHKVSDADIAKLFTYCTKLNQRANCSTARIWRRAAPLLCDVFT